MNVVGFVEKFVSISEDRVFLRGFSGEVIQKRIIIIPEKKYPFKITDVTTLGNGFIDMQLDEIKQPGQMHYALTVTNLKKTKGHYSQSIVLRTDSHIRPEIKILVYGHVLAVE